MAVCPNNCVDFDLVQILSASCTPKQRNNLVKRLMFYKCNITIPNPTTCNNLAPLVAAGDVIFTNMLRNGEFGEPTTEDRAISDCLPTQQVITGRAFTAQDTIAVDVDTDGEDAPYFDWEFWKTIKNNSLSLNVGFVMCDGTLIIPREPGSNAGLSATMLVYLNYEKTTSGQIVTGIEFKQINIAFRGDPLDFTAPDINLNDCEDLKQYA